MSEPGLLDYVFAVCIDQGRRMVFGGEPAGLVCTGDHWRANTREAGNILESMDGRVRLFDVLKDGRRETLTLATGCGILSSYSVPMVVHIIYGRHDDYATLLESDKVAIIHALHGAPLGEIDGLQAYVVASTTEAEINNTRVLSIAFAARIEAR